MDKSRKFSKFFKFFLSMALVLTVGFIPTVAKASDIVPRSDYRVYVQVQGLSYGSWITFSEVDIPEDVEDYGWLFDVDTGLVDQTQSDNFRYRIYYEFRTNANYLYTIEDYFEAAVGDNEFTLSDFTMSVYGSLDDNRFYSYFTPIFTDVAFTGNGWPNYVIDISYNRGFAGIMVEFSTNMYKTFPDSINGGRLQSYFMYGSTIISSDRGLSVPSVDSPDIDDFPDIDEYLPESGNPFMSVFSKFTSIPFVTTSLFIVTIVGVVSYVLFGRKS